MRHGTAEWHRRQYNLHYWYLVDSPGLGVISIDDCSPAFHSFEPTVIDRLYCDELLQELTEWQRTVVSMRLQGYSNKDIAEEYQCGTGNIREAIRKAKKRLLGSSLFN